tara:strand:+ start:10966 stop:11328 length:363 start_codon:yes stop_codon:yes gene_type:complete
MGKQKVDGLFVICIASIILTIVVCWVIYNMYIDIRAPEVFQRCVPGVCKFNVFTGVKTCPGNGDTTGIRLIPGAEFCTSANFCQKENFQCAVQANGSISCDGVCDTPQCRCVGDPTDGFV